MRVQNQHSNRLADLLRAESRERSSDVEHKSRWAESKRLQQNTSQLIDDHVKDRFEVFCVGSRNSLRSICFAMKCSILVTIVFPVHNSILDFHTTS